MTFPSLQTIRRRAAAEDGVTLVELLVATSLLLATLGIAVMLMNVASRNQPRIVDRNVDVGQARVLQERIGRELRQGYRLEGESATGFTVYTYRRVTLCGGTTPLASTLPAIQCRVTYSCTATACTRSETDPSGSVAPRVEQIVTGLLTPNVFTYPATNADCLADVCVKLAFPSESSEDSITLEDGFELRNRS